MGLKYPTFRASYSSEYQSPADTNSQRGTSEPERLAGLFLVAIGLVLIGLTLSFFSWLMAFR